MDYEQEAYGGAEASPDKPQPTRWTVPGLITLALIAAFVVGVFAFGNHYMSPKSSVSAPAPGVTNSAPDQQTILQFNVYSIAAAEMLKHPAANPLSAVVENQEVPEITPLNAGTAASSNPFGRCSVQEFATFTKFGASDDGRVLVRYGRPDPQFISLADRWPMVGGIPSPYSNCAGGEVAFVQDFGWFN